uniref:Uncharacterized protein n=1 Tax=Musa acuminata subsp. malaccensis TaxID=214687 RepID=A0A804JC84_MUSAM
MNSIRCRPKSELSILTTPKLEALLHRPS